MTPHALAVLAAVLALWTVAVFLPSARVRQFVFLSGSYLFYASWGGAGFLAVLIASSLMNYGLGALLRRRPLAGFLWGGIALNVLLLGSFKYLPSLFGVQSAGIAHLDFIRGLVMPLGMSFWTFQALSYLFDVYRDEEADPTLLEFCLYMAFWPTVTSGPIARLPDMLPQFRQDVTPTRSDVAVGLQRVTEGAVMKFGLAEIIGSGLIPGEGVSAGFDHHSTGWGGIDVWLLAFGFGFQLFFDFAGYTNMVIGAARMYGFRLPENFDRPYLSVTPSVFWTRWHMSLSFWIRDYIFMPLAAQRRNPWWPYVALVVSMTLFGVWHGAKWTFVAWGAYHGALLVIHRLGQQLKRRWTTLPAGQRPQWPAWLLTFCSVSLGWVFFRANDFQQASTMLGAILSVEAYGRFSLPPSFYLVIPSVIAGYFVYHAIASLLAEWRSICSERPGFAGYRAFTVELTDVLSQRPLWWLAPFTAALLVVVVIIAMDSASPVASFIYTTF